MREDRIETMFLVLALALCGYTFFPPQFISIHSNDNLDGYFVYHQIRPTVTEALFAANAKLDRAYDGVLYSYVGISELNLFSLLFDVFPQYWDIAVAYAVGVISLFLSFRAVIARLLPADRTATFVSSAVALYFCFLPYYPAFVGTFIALNLVVVGLCDLATRPGRSANALPFIVAPFTGNLIAGAIFYWPLAFIFGLFAFRGAIRRRALLLVSSSFLLQLIVDYRLLYLQFFNSEEIHRDSWLSNRTFNFNNLYSPAYIRSTIDSAVTFFTKGQEHYAWNPHGTTLLLLAMGLSGVLTLAAYRSKLEGFGFRPRVGLSRALTAYLLGVAMLALLSAVYGFLNANVLDFGALLKTTMQFERMFAVFVPTVASLTVAAGVYLTLATLRWRKTAVAVMTGAVVICTIAASEPINRRMQNTRHWLRAGYENPFIPNSTIGGYYLHELFDALKASLGRTWSEEVVVSVGLDPMVAAFHGFRHLDGYFPAYSADYKRKFREVIAPEFALDKTWQSYFDGWGSRAYIFVNRHQPDRRILINIDGCALHRLGGMLVISSGEIANPADSNLEYSKRVEAKVQGLNGALILYRIMDYRCPSE